MRKIIKKGYLGNVYLDLIPEKIIIKSYDDSFCLNYQNKSSMKIFKNEINSVKRLAKVKNNYVQTPVIISVNEKKLEWSQKFFKGVSFYKYLIRNCNFFYFNKLLVKQFYEFGKFLGEFHNSNFIKIEKNRPISEIHGDFSSHNIMFLQDNKLFIYDPGLSQRSVYDDLSKFLLNLKFINPIYSIFLSNKGLKKLEKSFLKGYQEKITKFKLDENLLKQEMLNQLYLERNYHSNKLPYKIKKYLMNLYNKRVYKKIQRELESE